MASRKFQSRRTVLDDYEGHENDVAVRFAIDEGPQTRVGAFHIVGNTTFTEAQLKREVNTAEGEPFSEYYVAEDRDNLLNYYFNRGFPEATFEAVAKAMPGETNRMDVTFTIHEGKQVSVDQVLVSGLGHTEALHRTSRTAGGPRRSLEPDRYAEDAAEAVRPGNL